MVRACCPCRSPASSTRPSGRRIALRGLRSARRRGARPSLRAGVRRRRVRRALTGRSSRGARYFSVGLGLFSGRGGSVLGHWKFPCFGDKAGGKRCGLIRGAGGLGDLGSIISHGKRGRFFPVRGQGNGLIKVIDTHVGSFQCAPAADSEALGKRRELGLPLAQLMRLVKASLVKVKAFQMARDRDWRTSPFPQRSR